MDLLVRIERTNGHFEASSLGDSHYRAAGVTREEAIDAFRRRIERDVAAEELVTLNVKTDSIDSFIGIFKDDESLTEIVEEIYKARDREAIDE